MGELVHNNYELQLSISKRELQEGRLQVQVQGEREGEAQNLPQAVRDRARRQSTV